MIRKIITIDQEKCNGCGLCVDACHEGAIGIQNGKAVLLRDDYCDGLGDCLPTCPTEAISFDEREALPYDEAAVAANKKQNTACSHSCPNAQSRLITPFAASGTGQATDKNTVSQLGQWPIQIKLVAVNAPAFAGADLLIAADCTAFAYGTFHADLMRGKVTLIGCPKLDDVDYTEKLSAILAHNDIASVTIVRMSVPCCGGLEHAARAAVAACGKKLPVSVVSITPEGALS